MLTHNKNLFINTMIMASAKSKKEVHPLFIFLSLFLLTIASSAFAQTKPSYRNHEEIDVGGGMKVEILKCTGEGPTEECDCIYFTDKRQNGTRMKQNANRIKEEERAANLAKGVNNPQAKNSVASAIAGESRPDKTIPASIIPKPKANVPVSPTPVSLEEAARKADSVARASSEKLKAALAKADTLADSTEMDKIYIPKVTEKGVASLEVSAPKKSTENVVSADNPTPVKENLKEDVAVSATPLVKDTMMPVAATKVPSPIKNTVEDVVPMVNNNLSTNMKSTASIKDSVPSSVDKITMPAVGEKVAEDVKATVDTLSSPITDSAEHNWVKQYKNIRSETDKPVQEAIKQADSTLHIQAEPIQAPLKENLKSVDSSSLKTPVSQDKSLEKKDAISAKVLETTLHQSQVSHPENNSAGIEKVNSLRDSAIGAQANPTVLKPELKDTATTKAELINQKTDSIPGSSPAITVATAKNAVESKDSLSSNPNAAANENSAFKENPLKTANTSERNVIGKTAEVNSKGEWEKVTIIDKETEFLYKVHYTGTSADHDEWVPVTQIRNIDTAVDVINADKPVKMQKINVNCTFEAPAPPVLNGDKFSEKLAKRKIYESYTTGKKASKSTKTGVTFLSLKAEEPYVNTVRITATNTLEVKLSLAPAGAMIYPVKTQYKVCEQVSGKTTSKILQSNFACFRNKEGAWTCANLN